MAQPTVASYWIAVVAVRWWGTHVGDASKFLLSIGFSMATTGAVLVLVLLVWRQPPTRGVDASGARI